MRAAGNAISAQPYLIRPTTPISGPILTPDMPYTHAQAKGGKHHFLLDDLATALVHLLRNCDAAEFKKYCPGVTQRGSCTSVSEMLLAMFRALHGDIVETGEVLDDDEAKPAARLCVAYALAPKVGRPRREVALREEAEKLAKEQAEERRRKHVLAQQRQRYMSAPDGLHTKAHVGGRTCRGTIVEPVRDAALCLESRVCLRTLQSTFVLTYPKLHMYALL
jgi:hypothetical protein